MATSLSHEPRSGMSADSSYQTHVALGRTGLRVSRIGLGSSFNAPTAAYEEAFERGVRYFYWGSLRKKQMGDAIRNLAPRHRSELVVVVQSYARFGWMVKASVERALRRLKLDHADVLLLGWHNSEPAARILDASGELVSRGLVSHVALSSHHRPLFPQLIDDQRVGVWHVRYNAVHRGAEREVFPTLKGMTVEERPGVVTYTSTRWGHLVDPKRVPSGERVPTGTDCYRFALSDPNVDVAICGPDDTEQLRQALVALEQGPLSEDDQRWMRRVGDHIYGKDITTTVRD